MPRIDRVSGVEPSGVMRKFLTVGVASSLVLLLPSCDGVPDLRGNDGKEIKRRRKRSGQRPKEVNKTDHLYYLRKQ